MKKGPSKAGDDKVDNKRGATRSPSSGGRRLGLLHFLWKTCTGPRGSSCQLRSLNSLASLTLTPSSLSPPLSISLFLLSSVSLLFCLSPFNTCCRPPPRYYKSAFFLHFYNATCCYTLYCMDSLHKYTVVTHTTGVGGAVIKEGHRSVNRSSCWEYPAFCCLMEVSSD